MRGLVPGLASPHPLGETLPSLYREDGFATRLVSAMDDALAPIFSSLDCLDAYLDPRLAPDDFLDWLGSWVGVALDHTWPVERRRLLVAAAIELYRLRGTASGLASQVAIYTGGQVEVEESGATGWSTVPNAVLPGDPTPRLVVRVTVRDPDAIAAARLDALVAAAKPAHMPHQVVVLTA